MSKGSKSNCSGQRGGVSVGSKSGGGNKGSGEQFFKNGTMQNTEGLSKKSSIKRNQPS